MKYLILQYILHFLEDIVFFLAFKKEVAKPLLSNSQVEPKN